MRFSTAKVMQILLGCWIAAFVCIANAASAQPDGLPPQTDSDRSCTSISGRYLFHGKDDLFTNKDRADGSYKFDLDRTGLRSFFNVLWGAPSIWGDPKEVELVHDVNQNVLQVIMHGENLRNVPIEYNLLKVFCVAGVVTFDFHHEGYSDGSPYKTHNVFQFSKDAGGKLIVHGMYNSKTAFLFFWNSESWEITTRFQPASNLSGIDLTLPVNRK